MTAVLGASALIRRHHVPRGPIDLVATTFPLRQGLDDPTTVVRGGEVLRALRTEEGPASLHMRLEVDQLVASAVGPGASVALDVAPVLAGLGDDPRALRPRHACVAEAVRRSPGLRLTSGTAVFDALVWAVLAQKVVGLDARRSYRDLVRRLSAPAPGDTGLLLPPSPDRVSAAPYWLFHECNVERRRAGVIIELARRAATLNRLDALPAVEARARLECVPGIGPWTAATVTAVSHGDADALPLGDYHLPNVVAHALAGEARGDDARMLELLAPYAGQRGRVARLLMAGGRGAPRRGPRMPRHDIRRV